VALAAALGFLTTLTLLSMLLPAQVYMVSTSLHNSKAYTCNMCKWFLASRNALALLALAKCCQES